MMEAHETPVTPDDPGSGLPVAPAVQRYAVAELLRGAREAILDHDGAEYRLRITASGKLILTK